MFLIDIHWGFLSILAATAKDGDAGLTYFVCEKQQNSVTEAIVTMETEFPQLQRDPWWIKYTEILTRFPMDAPVVSSLQDPLLQKTFLGIVIVFSVMLVMQLRWLKLNPSTPEY